MLTQVLNTFVYTQGPVLGSSEPLDPLYKPKFSSWTFFFPHCLPCFSVFSCNLQLQ